jgi:acid phosphatase type 7
MQPSYSAFREPRHAGHQEQHAYYACHRNQRTTADGVWLTNRYNMPTDDGA